VKYTVKVNEDGTVVTRGVEWGYGSKPLEYMGHGFDHDNDMVWLAIKIPGGQSWVSRGETGYSPTEIMVLYGPRVANDQGFVEYESFLSFPVQDKSERPKRVRAFLNSAQQQVATTEDLEVITDE
jgi:hypothetical protein